MWLGLALFVGVAHAVDWESALLGEYYPVSDVEDSELVEASDAVLWFGNATGFVVSPQGHIVTNHHVYESFGDRGTVWRAWRGQAAEESLAVELITADEDWDVAVYRVVEPSSALPYLPIRTSSPRVGEKVAVIGHPHSWDQRVSYGRVLADDLVIGTTPSVEYSAQTWWGSSGSPVVDDAGRVIAVHWGWDSEGASHGRLTGVPFDQMAEHVAVVGRIAERWGEVGTRASRCDADAFALTSRLVRRAVATNGAGRSLDAVTLQLETSDARCAGEITDVQYNLHPTFRDPTVSGDLARAGFPVTLHTWGFFPASADVILASGQQIRVPGYVRWER